MENNTPVNVPHTRVNVDELLERIHLEAQDVNLNARFMYIVKVGSKFGCKNTAENIKIGKPRYIICDNEHRFFRESEAYDAARILGGKVDKQ